MSRDQQSDTLCCVPRTLSSSRQHFTSFDLISVAVIAFIAAWLSIKKVIPSCGIALTADSRAAVVTAKTSAWKTLLWSGRRIDFDIPSDSEKMPDPTPVSILEPSVYMYIAMDCAFGI